MSAFGGKADMIQGGAECPLIAKSGHWGRVVMESLGLPYAAPLCFYSLKFAAGHTEATPLRVILVFKVKFNYSGNLDHRDPQKGKWNERYPFRDPISVTRRLRYA